ncbi:MAG TPA: CAAX prenyl protease-related protein [Usitatibacter sp.]|nr:CAAX prenyl protease-related protein [Usitatibacter sp.]
MTARVARPVLPQTGLLASPVFSRAAPFALFILFVALQPLAAGIVDERWLVAARGLVVGALLLLLWPTFRELHKTGDRPRLSAGDNRGLSPVLAAVAAGAAVFAAWIHLDGGWMSFAGEGRGFVPLREDGSLDVVLVALRLAGLALVVPIVEELFWRSLVMRWITSRDFLALDPKRVSMLAFGISSALFALEHSQWLAGLLAGLAYGWLYMRSANLWIPILSHATTNGLLGLWILATGSWRYW